MRRVDRFAVCALLIFSIVHPHDSADSSSCNPSSEWLFMATDVDGERSDQCARDLRTYQDSLGNLTLWAVKMFDSSSKGTNGLLSGDNFYFGHYDQCLSVSVPDLRISGRYTVVKINFVPTNYPDGESLGTDDFKGPNPKSKVWKSTSHTSKMRKDEFYWAVCHPDSCSPDRLKSMLKSKFSRISDLNVSVNVDPTMSSTSGDKKPFRSGHYIFFTFIGLNLLLVMIGTWYDLTVLKESAVTKTGVLKSMLKSFSVPSNVRRLLKNNKNPELSVINGLKVFAVCNVIIGRRIFTILSNALSNPEFSEQVTEKIWCGFYFNSALIMETFFVVSGFLNYHLIVKEIDRTRTFNFLVMLAYRWLRIIPVYTSLIATYVFLLPHLGDGPLWKSIIFKESKRCEISWWSNLSFLNNYVSTEHLCAIPSWYLACDMHFFLLGSMLTYVMWKSTKIGIAMMTGALALSVYIPSKTIYDNSYWGSPPIYAEPMRDLNNELNYTDMYIKSHNRATTYLVGLMMAVIYGKLKEREYKFSQTQLRLNMIVCFCLSNAIFLSTYTLYVPGQSYEPWTHLIYFSFTRIIWALIISFTIVAHGTTGLGLLSDFLGHRIFCSLGKLTFSAYMYQEIVQLVDMGTMRSSGYASHFRIAWMTCGDITSTYLIAIVVHFMIESPCDKIQKKITRLLIQDTKMDIKEEKKMATVNQKELELYRTNSIKT